MNRIRFVVLMVLMTAIGLTCLSKIHAQGKSITASLSGTVSDPAGARVPKASLKLTDADLGITRLDSTGPEGDFTFALLPSGTYVLEVSAPGFKTTRQDGIVLAQGTR